MKKGSNYETKTKKQTAKRMIAVLLLFSLACVFLVFRLFALTVLQHDYYSDKSYDQITTSSALRAERGKIYDSSMNVLACERTVWRIFACPRDIIAMSKEKGVDYAAIIANGLGNILSIDSKTLESKLRKSEVLDVTVRKSASAEEYSAVIDFVKTNGLDGLVQTEAQSSRYYPEETLAAHVLGFVGSDNQGLYGLEYYYNKELSGKDGYYLYAKDANGRPISGEYSDYVPATDGLSLITTIDTYIQKALESQLETIRVNHQVNNRVAGIVMDTETGAILAMATSSPFDPNSPYELDSVSQAKLDASGYTEGSEEYRKLKTELMQIMWSNKAVSETYEPGSTFKIITVSAALDLGVAKPTDTFSCCGYHTVGGWRIKCHKVTGHGSGFTLAYGLQMSCNPTMMNLAEKIGADSFYSYVDRFGYLEKTGIDLPSEASTIFHDPDAIGSTELATASFGQRFKVSIISQITAIAAVANGGKLVTPYVVEKIIDKEGNVITEHETEVRRQVISEDVARTVSEILEAGVSGDGGAKNAAVDGYKIAAKTGTSQKFDVLDANGNSYLRIGSTIAYAPSDQAGIAVIIVVDEPMSNVKYGSVVAAPYVGELYASILPYLEYKSSAESSYVEMESYVGLLIEDAKKNLSNLGVKFEIIGNGDIVCEQTPDAGAIIDPSSAGIILYAVSTSDATVILPDLRGISAYDANILLAKLGLTPIFIDSYTLDGNSIIIYQSQAAGTAVKKGSTVKLKTAYSDFED